MAIDIKTNTGDMLAIHDIDRNEYIVSKYYIMYLTNKYNEKKHVHEFTAVLADNAKINLSQNAYKKLKKWLNNTEKD